MVYVLYVLLTAGGVCFIRTIDSWWCMFYTYYGQLVVYVLYVLLTAGGVCFIRTVDSWWCVFYTYC